LKSPLVFVSLILYSVLLRAQDEEKTKFPLEKFYVEREKTHTFLSKFVFGLSMGVGNTFLSHNTAGFGIYQLQGGAPTLFDTNPEAPYNVQIPYPYPQNMDQAIRYSNWFNDVIKAEDPISTSVFNPVSFQAITTAPHNFRGNALSIPSLKLTVHYEYKQFRIGAGYSYELMMLGILKGTSTSYPEVYTLKPASSVGLMSKYFGILGYTFYRLGDYLFTADLNVGNFSPGTNFNSALIQKGLFYNLGLTVERDFSEYFKVFARPSVEMKSYSIALAPSNKSISHTMNAIYLNVGVTYRIPELPKCYNKDCRVQINHAHGNREYRSRVHKFYQKQNPGYGENDPVLIKYKGKNKRKLNPY
jgi:hypothetical protein